MSEQENSRSPPCSAVLAPASAEEPRPDQEPPGATSCPGPDADMGNNIFTAPEEAGDEGDGGKGEAEDRGSDKVDCKGSTEADVCEEAPGDLPPPPEVTLPDLKEDKVPSDSAGSEAVPDSDNGASEEKDGRDGVETEEGEVVSDVQDAKGLNGDSRGCGDAPEGCRQTPGEEDAEQGCEGKEEAPTSHMGESDTPEPSNIEPSEALLRGGEEAADDSDGNETVAEETTETVNGTVEEERPSEAVPCVLECEAALAPTQNGTVEGGEEVAAPQIDPTRDTDSEAGDSVCSEDGEHGAVCRGGGGCPHQEAEAGWEYVVDEEFNVPRRPVFNGAADHLERRSSLKRRASEESEGKALRTFDEGSIGCVCRGLVYVCYGLN